MGELLAVLSGKGGTGKTSVCAALACALAEEGKKVLCIDCDVGLRNLDIALGPSHYEALSFQDVCAGGYSLEEALAHPEFGTLRFLTAPISCTAADVDGGSFQKLLHQARQSFDYVFLDAPAGIEAGFSLAARFADRILLVTGPDPAAVRDAARAGQVLEAMGKTNVRLIVNRITRKIGSRLHTTVDDIMDTAGLPLLGIVPEDPHVTMAAATGVPVVLLTHKGASPAYLNIARRLLGQRIPLLRIR